LICDDVCSCFERSKCRTPGKQPIGGDRRATDDEKIVREWWSGDWTDANLGIQLERLGLVDIRNDSSAKLVDFQRRGLPETVCFESGSGPGHEHDLYQRPQDCRTARKCESGVFDLMSMGIAVVAPCVSGIGEGVIEMEKEGFSSIHRLTEQGRAEVIELDRRGERL
jgi:hypothetical protein